MTVAGQTERPEAQPTDDITTRLDNLAQSLAGEYPPHTLMDLAEAASLITTLRATLAGQHRREAEAGTADYPPLVELGRVCAVREHLNRAAVRLWREFVFPALCREHGWSWCISYQDAVLHSGDLYRFDGWVRLATSRSGTDARSGRKGRSKVIWGWHADPDVRRSAALPTPPSRGEGV